MWLLRIVWVVWCLIVSSGMTFASDNSPVKLVDKAELKGSELIQALRSGGYVLYLRHTSTERNKINRNQINFQDCKTQRNLSDFGRQQAESIGKGISVNQIPIGKVISSPYCRCKDTAYLAFGKMEINENLAFAIGESSETTQRLKSSLIEMLLSQPVQGSNTVIVSHTANLMEATGIWPKPEGVMAIFKPTNGGELEFYGLYSPDIWSTLLQSTENLQ